MSSPPDGAAVPLPDPAADPAVAPAPPAGDSGATAPAPETRRPAPGRGFFRENIEALFAAFVLALVIKHFALETFRVPTPSMEPAIIGRRPGGDNLLVNKLAYRFRDPARFDIAVFRYPLRESVNFIKRIAGLPGERIWIREGDIFTAPAAYAGSLENAFDPATRRFLHGVAIARKRDTVLEDMLADRPCLPPPEVTLASLETVRQHWTTDAWDRVEVRDGGVVLRSDRPMELGLRRRVDDSRTDADFDPATAGAGGRNPVSDLRLTVRIRPLTAGGRVFLRLRRRMAEAAPPEPITLTVPVGTGSAVLSGPHGFDERTIEGLSLSADRSTTIALSCVDQRITVHRDGAKILERDIDHVPVATGFVERAAAFGIEGGAALFDDVRVLRDIHWTGDGAGRPYGHGATELTEGRLRVPPDSYFMLGDNSASSRDSRFWFRRRITVKRTGEQFWGDSECVDEDPDRRTLENPWIDAGGRLVFVDTFGNHHAFPPGEIIERKDERFPFVHRDHLLGRAFMTFWPAARISILR